MRVLLVYSTSIFLDGYVHLGQAVGLNPGYLKLRKIRAAQSIAKTVSTTDVVSLSSVLD